MVEDGVSGVRIQGAIGRRWIRRFFKAIERRRPGGKLKPPFLLFPDGALRYSPTKTHSKDVRENVIRMRLSGFSWSEIYKRSGISSSTARKWVDDYCCSKGRRKQLLVIPEGKPKEPGIR